MDMASIVRVKKKFTVLHYLIIIIMQMYLKVLNFQYACQVHFVECVSKIKLILSITFHAIHGAV